MTVTVQQPIGSHDIVTDLNTLRETIILAGRISQLDKTDGMTEAETSTARAERDRLTEQLHGLVDKVRESTITIRLRGLRSSEWNQYILQCTRTVDGKPVKDGNKLLRLAVPGMVEGVLNHAGVPITMSDTDLNTLLESLADTQSYELLQTIQTLNSPAVSLPKDVTRLTA